jgi:hypothetical protein
MSSHNRILRPSGQPCRAAASGVLGEHMKKSLAPIAVAALMLAGCASGTVSAAPSATPATTAPADIESATAEPTVTVTVTPTTSAIATTGSYANDVAALGIKPDDMQDYAKWMKERICDQDSIGLGVAVRSIGGSDAGGGGGVQVVRLTNAYFCPEKTQEIEEALKYFDQ